MENLDPAESPSVNHRRSILFVDDDALVLQGLRRMLRPFRDQWDLEFAESGRAALELLDRHPFTVIVTDMQMQGMDGANLLQAVRSRYPDTVRFVLSGQVDAEPLLQCIDTTHQFLAKPCNADSLRTALIHATSLCPLPGDAALRVLVTESGQLPSPPALLVELDEAVHHGDATVDDLGAIIARDVGLSGQVLKLANSAFFGLHRNVLTPAEAVAYLGLEFVKALAATAFLQQQARGDGIATEEIADICRHSLAVSALAVRIARFENASESLVNECAAAGLLHDAGKLLLASRLPSRWAQVGACAAERGISGVDAEQALLGCTHQEIGAYLFSLWGLPFPLIEAVAHHHHPVAMAGTFTALTGVHAANAILRDQEFRSGGSRVPPSPLNLEYLDQLQLAPRIPLWRQLRRNVPVTLPP